MQMQFKSRDEVRSGIGAVWQSPEHMEENHLHQYSMPDAAPTQVECVGENQVKKGGVHRKSLSTGQMVQSNTDITQLFNQLVLNLSPRQSSKSTGSDGGIQEEHCVDDFEDVESGDHDLVGEDDVLSHCSSQLSSSSQITRSTSSPEGEQTIPINQLKVTGSFNRIRNNIFNNNSTSSSSPTAEQELAQHSKKPSFDVSALRLNLSRLDSSASVGSSLDMTVDQILAMSVGRALWASQTPTPRKATSVSPSPSPEHIRSDCQWVQALPGEECNKDALVSEASAQIAELTRRQVTLSVEKELLEEEIQFWRERVKCLEDKLMEAEESSAEKDEILEQLEQQLQQLMALSPNLLQQHHQQGGEHQRVQLLQHSFNREESVQLSSHHNPPANYMSTTSDLSLSFQSGGSSLLKVGQMGEDVVNRVYPPMETKAFEQLLQDKKPLVSPHSNKQQIHQQNQQQLPQQQKQQQQHLDDSTSTSMTVSGYVLGMLWSGETAINIQGFSTKMFSMIKEVLFSEKFSAFWDWFLMVVFPLLGYAGLSVCITLLFAGVTFAWRRASNGKLNKWLNSGTDGEKDSTEDNVEVNA